MENNQIKFQEVFATFSGDIDQLAVQRFFNAFATFKNGGIVKVNLLLQSYGGTLPDGFAIYTFLKNIPLEISMYNCGFVGSISILLFLTGNKRYASNLSKFMIHRSTCNFINPTNIPDIKNRAEIIEKDDKNIELILRKQIKMSEDQWTVYNKMDLFITPDEAIKYGIIHEIAEFEPRAELPLVNI